MTETKPFQILLAEDNPGDILLVREALKEHRVACELRVIRDGAEAITWINSLDTDPRGPSLDLLLLDMHLPKHDGKDILERLRSTGRLAQTPVVVMTSSDPSVIELQAEERAARPAALVYFRKPSTLNEFMQLGSIVRDVLASGARPTGQQTAPANEGNTRGAA
jgi:chemotaxis family two-component system response regulator Rcp1